MKSTHYNDNVFINCPFDSAYKPLFDAMVFTVHDCGFVARCALDLKKEMQAKSGLIRFITSLRTAIMESMIYPEQN